MKSMTKIASIAVLIVLASGQFAAARPDLRLMTCLEAQHMVKRNGSVVVTTGPYTFSRYVSDRRYCDRGQAAFPQLGPTRDNPKCLVGLECRQPLFSN
ncbi:hypothetical protein [uncultured Roseibium sp.]|uniref:hypothetical protein n=1 Tax=uncultured Roseibium sp. TaxID=1936171 RepID=UPI0032171030